jgi:Histidine kinase-, DNA gyrase B-, and HSP90-like ATPase
MAKLFNCTPKPAMLRSVQNERWNVSGALAELLDNSFGPGRGNATAVTIFHDPAARTLTVLDNGRGMDAIGRLFQHGNSIGHSIGDIGEYGAGGTKALLWLASRVSIWTLREQMVQHDQVVWKSWFNLDSFDDANVSNDWRRANSSNTPPELLAVGHGTLIRMHLLPTRYLRVNNVVRDLARFYSTGLRKGRHISWLSCRKGLPGETAELTDPFTTPSDHSRTINFDLVLEHRGQHLPVHGSVTFDENTPQSESRVQIGFGYRMIRSTTDCFQSRDGEEKYAGIGVSGWLDLGEGWQPYLSTTKDAIDDAPLYGALMDHVFKNIKPLLQQAERKSFSVQFDDLAIGLEQALNSRAGDVVVRVGTELRRPPPSHTPIDEPPPNLPGPPLEIPQPNGLLGDSERNVAPSLAITIYQEGDAALEGALCQAGVRGNDIFVAVNRDHAFVQEALKARPVNRMALNVMIVDELARAIVEVDDGILIKKIFHRDVASAIYGIEHNHHRSRIVARRLIDRVRDSAMAA